MHHADASAPSRIGRIRPSSLPAAVKARPARVGHQPDVVEAAGVQRAHHLHHPLVGNGAIGAQEKLVARCARRRSRAAARSVRPRPPAVFCTEICRRPSARWSAALPARSAPPRRRSSAVRAARPRSASGAATMKMISSTSITSTNGVTLISLIAAAWPRDAAPPPPAAARLHHPRAHRSAASSWRDRIVANSSAKAS